MSDVIEPSRFFLVASALVVALTSAWAIAAIGFLIGLPIERWQGIASLLVGIAFLWAPANKLIEKITRVLLFVAILAVVLILSSITVDKSFDGWWYHQLGVISLANGWNPIAEPLVRIWFSQHGASIGYPATAPLPDGIWTSFYPKASWILGAEAVVWGLPIDAGKYPALVLIIASGFVAYRCLRVWRLDWRWAASLAAIAALNPVAVAQATTYYVDGILGTCLTILIFSLLAYWITRDWRDLLLALCASFIACNLKFTGPVYVTIIVGPSLLYWLWQRRMPLRQAAIVAAGVVVLILGSANPYWTNFRIGGSPIYPLNRMDIMQSQMSPDFSEKNRFSKLLISLTFSNSLSFSDIPGEQVTHLSNPLQNRGLKELRNFVTLPDLRIGGFGPLFWIPLISAFALVLRLAPKLRTDMGISLVLFGLMASILINPELWWARYVPQTWIFPVLLIALGLKSNRGTALAYTAICVMALTSLVSVIGWSASSSLLSSRYRANLGVIKASFLVAEGDTRKDALFPALAYRLRERGIALTLSQKGCDRPIQLIWLEGCAGK